MEYFRGRWIEVDYENAVVLIFESTTEVAWHQLTAPLSACLIEWKSAGT